MVSPGNLHDDLIGIEANSYSGAGDFADIDLVGRRMFRGFRNTNFDAFSMGAFYRSSFSHLNIRLAFIA